MPQTLRSVGATATMGGCHDDGCKHRAGEEGAGTAVACHPRLDGPAGVGAAVRGVPDRHPADRGARDRMAGHADGAGIQPRRPASPAAERRGGGGGASPPRRHHHRRGDAGALSGAERAGRPARGAVRPPSRQPLHGGGAGHDRGAGLPGLSVRAALLAAVPVAGRAELRLVHRYRAGLLHDRLHHYGAGRLQEVLEGHHPAAPASDQGGLAPSGATCTGWSRCGRCGFPPSSRSVGRSS